MRRTANQTKLLRAALAAIALALLPTAAFAAEYDIGTCNTPPGTAWDTDTVSAWVGGNGVSIAASLLRDWGGRGWAQSDVTSYGNAPYEHWVVIHCDDTYGNTEVSPHVVGWSASSLYTIDLFCPGGEVGSASEHWAYNDAL